MTQWKSAGLQSERLGFETYICRVVSLSKILYSTKVLVIPRKRCLRPDMTEKLLTGMLSLNTNKYGQLSDLAEIQIHPSFYACPYHLQESK